MIRPVAAAALVLLAFSASEATAGAVDPSPPQLSLEPLWTLEGFDSPESVLPSADGRELYVSNVGGEGGDRDGNGFISRVAPDGRMIEREWITGLDAPKGMALRDGRLFVTDIDKIVEIDAVAGRIVARHQAEGATFLNDAAVAPDGTILASDSGGSRIYALQERGGTSRVEIWALDPRLSAINGLLPEPERLVIVTMQGVVLTMDWGTRAIGLLAVGVGDGDGVVPTQDGGYIVGEWPGRLFHISGRGDRRMILDRRQEPQIYQNDFVRVGDVLIVPNLSPGTVTAHRILNEGVPPPSR
ncbi:hypothetical protein Q0812_12430 [Brevundimonas sp. 2R-24]|uniref:Uncharacterized protein n=1 Tax=Peiella sedimenti TaxID=3061083 RepID=A0ABT8SNT0_9CAUL|nr:hypothetical protein [Caulobacteraceae bacterium XZ-24]